ncbi:MAG TPA: hypothetical protein VD794_07010 [Flavisolibacter sp.]|nr:hypothetical protein [Flavisolibacter sp.]
MEKDNEPYCTNCGGDNLAYIEQYACGEHWECKDCKHEICYNNPNKQD